jgi:hypothetical protein
MQLGDEDMRYFKRIKTGVEVQRFLDEIGGVSDAWNLSTGRQSKIAVQREADAIPIRGLVKSMIAGRKRRDVQESRYTRISRRFHVARGFLEAFAAEHDAKPGRGKLVRLKAGNRVYPHIDRGEYYALRDRYHLILRSAAGSYLKCGEEEIRMQEGEIWWFDNKQVHEAYNDGDSDRIHFIFDLLPRSRILEARSHQRAA